jgi:hypothetical protein
MYFRKGRQGCLGMAKYGVQQVKSEGERQAAKPFRIKRFCDNLDERRSRTDKIAALTGDEGSRFFNEIEILRIDTYPQFPHSPPTSSGPFTVVIGCRRFLADDPGICGKGTFSDGFSGENFHQFGNNPVFGGDETELFKFGEVVVEIDGCRTVSPWIAEVEPPQAVDEKSRMSGLVNDRKEEKKGLLEMG